MSKSLERLVGRAVIDEKFRHALLSDPEGAAKEAGFELGGEEMAQIKAGIATSDQPNQMFDTVRGHWY